MTELKNIKNDLNTPNPSKLRISTMTATCCLGETIDLEKLYKNVEINSFLTYIDFGGFPPKGFNPKNISEKKASKKKVFYNQITTILQLMPGITINVKLFNNGAISMTGLKDDKYGIEAIEKFSKIINEVCDLNCKLSDFNIVLINSDYHIGYEIKRDILHQILIKNFKIYSSYEPCIYPGVNSKYFWNEDYKNNEYIGRCYCTKSCEGKGNGRGNGNCKKITISTFQSGSVIITGARNKEQIKNAYDFINNIFRKYYDILKKENAPFLELEDTNVKQTKKVEDSIVYLKKSNIKILYQEE